MNCSSQILYGYWFWSFYHCLYIICKLRPFLTQYCINDIMTGDKVSKNFEISLINIFLIIMFNYLWVLTLQIWASFDPVLEWDQTEGLWMSHNMTVWKNWSVKWITNLEKLNLKPLLNGSFLNWSLLTLLSLIFLSQLEYSIQIWPLFGPILILYCHKDC